MSKSPQMHYVVRLLPNRQELQVQLKVRRKSSRGPIHLKIPTWVPGDYNFAAYARDLFDLQAFASGNRKLIVKRSGWQGFVVLGARKEATITYSASACATEFAETSGLIQKQFALILGTRFLFDPNALGACDVTYKDLPKHWAVHHPAGARQIGKRAAWEYPSFELLLDSPLVLGSFEHRQRNVCGTVFHLIFVDKAVGFESTADRFLDKLEKIAKECHNIFGEFPFEYYTFIMSFNPGADWGLEHLSSSTCGLGPDVFTDNSQFATGLRVCAHELFHAWNVRRLRPHPLEKLSRHLSSGSFTDGLWLAEGFTRYYEFLLCTRIQAYSVEQFFSNIVGYFKHLTIRPSYSRVSATESSLTSYLNHRKYPGCINNSIDYYDKGMLIAFEIDAFLRTRVSSYTLDRAFLQFYKHFVGRSKATRGYSTVDVINFFGNINNELGKIVENLVTRPGGLRVPEVLRAIGFELKTKVTYFFGLAFNDGDAATIADILDMSPASDAGLAPGDVLTRINGLRFAPSGLKWTVTKRRRVILEVLRGNQLLTFKITPVKRSEIVSLIWCGAPTQAQLIAKWLHKDDFSPKPREEFGLDFYENFHGIETVF